MITKVRNLLTIACCLLLASCGSVRKSSSSTQSYYDSSATENEVVAARQESRSLKAQEQKQSWSNQVTLEYDPVQYANELAGPADTPAPRKNPVHTIKVNGQQIESSLPIRSATIKLDGQTRQLQLDEQHQADSQAASKSRQAQVIAALDANSSKKEKWPTWLLFLLPAVFMAAIVWVMYEYNKAQNHNA